MPQLKLKVAIPKKGRLRKPVIKILKKANYLFSSEENILLSSCKNAEIDFIFLRNEDIPILLDEGKIDLGITGKDIILEKKPHLKELLSLEMGNCELALAGPKNFEFKNLAQFKKKKIATSFPNITKKFFQQKKIPIACVALNGSVEVMLKLNVCHAIIDLVETGNTLKENQLKKWWSLGEYHVGIYTKKKWKNNFQINSFLKRLKGIVLANHYSILEYNIKKQHLQKAEKITPGLDAPTISNLDDPNLLAIKVMIKKSEVISAMDQLEKIGATGMFEIEINNCRL